MTKMLTRRRVLIVATAALGIAGALVAWLYWPAPAQSRGPRPVLTVRLARAVQTITPGTPLTISVYLTGRGDGASYAIGSTSQPWDGLVHLESADSERPLPWSFSRGGAVTIGMTSGETGPGGLQGKRLPAAQISEGGPVHTVEFEAGPENTMNAAAGTYQVRAVLESGRWMTRAWRGRVESTPVTIVVRSPRPGDAGADAQRLTLSAEYYLRHRRFADAARMAEALVRGAPGRAASHLLHGDALAGLNERARALQAYRLALTLVPRSYETPVDILRRIERLTLQQAAPR